MKKITVFILTALLLLSLIGCDNSAQPASSTSTVTTAVPTTGTTVPTTTPIPTTVPPTTSTVTTVPTTSSATTATTSSATTVTTTTATTSSATTVTTTTAATTSQKPSTSNTQTLVVNIDGQKYTYTRLCYGDSSLTKKDILKQYIISAWTGTFMEGIVVCVYSTEEYPDFSYVLHVSTGGTWTYQLIDKQ